MRKNYLKYILLSCLFMVSLSMAGQPPYLINKVISPNKIVGLNNQKLLVIDFWATWCSPCAPATTQLEILQQTKPDEVFIVSVSDEKEETISTYLQKTPIRLAVIEDYLPNSMIDLFSVKSRPYAVLLTLDGRVLYKGHPSGITAKKIDEYALQEKSQPAKKWSDLFYTVKETDSPPKSSEKDKELVISKHPATEKKMDVNNGLFQYAGPLSGLVKYLLDCSNYQILLQGMTDYDVSMTCGISKLSNAKLAVLKQIENRLSFTVQNGNKTMEASLLQVVNPKLLWDDRQINWDNGLQSTYLIGTDRIEADNLSLKEVANLLSDTKRSLFYYKGNDTSLHDWNFNYLYDNLMIEDLNNFGIQLTKEKITLPVYIISPQ